MYNQHSGVVQTDPRVYLVYWGSSWSSGGDPYGAMNRLYNFYSGVGGSSWGNVMTQYQQGCTPGTWNCTGAHVGNPTGVLKYWWKDSSAITRVTPTHTDIANEAIRAARKFGDLSGNTQYVIALPHGYGDTDFAAKGGTACAWHDKVWVDSTHWVTYTALPYQPDAANCHNYTVHKDSSGILDGETILASHEYAETVTDPYLNAWYDRHGAENGDKCNIYYTNATFSTGSFPVQATWSNYHRAYYNSGCAFSA